MNWNALNKHKRFLINFAYYAVLVGLVYIVFKYGLSIAMPFLLAFAVAVLLKGAVDGMQRDWKLPRGVGSAVTVVLFYGVLGLLLTLLSIRVVTTVQDFVSKLPRAYLAGIAPAISDMFDGLQGFLQRFDTNGTLGLDQMAQTLSQRLGSLVSSFSSSVLTGTAKLASGLPGLMVRLIFMVLATFYFVLDYDKIAGFVLRQLPARVGTVLTHGKAQLVKTLSQYIRSYALILFITFCELCIGMSILKIPSYGTWAVIIAIFDILPVVGSGFVIYPWAIISFIQGRTGLGIGLAIMGVAMMIVRNIIEPKIVGDHVGLHPLLTLIAMFVGGYFFGGMGVVGLPVTLALIAALQKEGTIQVYCEPKHGADAPEGPDDAPEHAPDPPEEPEASNDAPKES